WLSVALARPDWLVALSSGAGAFVALIGATVAVALGAGNIAIARGASLLALLALLVIGQCPPAGLLPSRWTAGDGAALELLPWLAAGVIVLAALRATRPDRYLALTGAALGLVSVGLPVVTRLTAVRWTL